jgi:hypothetical protein
MKLLTAVLACAALFSSVRAQDASEDADEFGQQKLEITHFFPNNPFKRNKNLSIFWSDYAYNLPCFRNCVGTSDRAIAWD